MKISIDENGEIMISENYVGVVMRASDQRIGVCERDGGFEINIIQSDGSHEWYAIADGKIAHMVANPIVEDLMINSACA